MWSSLCGKTWFWNVVSGLMSQKVQVVVCRILDWPLYQHFLITKVMYKCIMCVFENWCVLNTKCRVTPKAGGAQCTFSKSGPALSAIPTHWECQPQGVIGHNSLQFSLLFSQVKQYFKKQKLFIFVKSSPLVSPVYLKGTL